MSSISFTEEVLSFALGELSVQVDGLASDISVTKYRSRQSYLGRFPPLILQEVKTSLAEALKGCKQRFVNALVTKRPVKPDDRSCCRIQLRITSPLEFEMDCGPTMLAMLLRQGNVDLLAICSYDIDSGTIEALCRLNTIDMGMFRLGDYWEVSFLAGLMTHQRMFQACEALRNSSICATLMPSLLSYDHPPTIQAWQRSNSLEGTCIDSLNDQQKSAVHTFSQLSSGVGLLVGPPGTGKTSTLVKLIANLVLQKKRVLVTAPSNKAVQVLARRFSKDYPASRILLNGNRSKTSDDLVNLLLDEVVDKFLRSKQLINDIGSNLRVFLRRNIQGESSIDGEFKGKTAGEMLSILENKVLEAMENVPSTYFRSVQRDFSAALNLIQESQRNMLLVDVRIVEAIKFIDSARARLEAIRPAKAKKGNLFAHIKQYFIHRAEVIFTTLSACGRHCMIDHAKGHIDFVIVDEAGQSVEAETLIPLQLEPKCLLLVGDTKQLPATVKCKVAQEYGFGRSMMERLEQSTTSRILMLKEQYRMDSTICQWPSSRYYNGELRTASTVLTNPIRNHLRQPIAFYDIANGVSKRAPNGSKSILNKLEANYAVNCISTLLTEQGMLMHSSAHTKTPLRCMPSPAMIQGSVGDVTRQLTSLSLLSAPCHPSSSSEALKALPPPLRKIGVIAFYKGQVELINDLLAKNERVQFLSKQLSVEITVSTVDGFQGDECDVIILSCVRASEKPRPGGSIGFLSDQRRLNVAITRAKSTLIILGQRRTFLPDQQRIHIQKKKRKAEKAGSTGFHHQMSDIALMMEDLRDRGLLFEQSVLDLHLTKKKETTQPVFIHSHAAAAATAITHQKQSQAVVNAPTIGSVVALRPQHSTQTITRFPEHVAVAEYVDHDVVAPSTTQTFTTAPTISTARITKQKDRSRPKCKIL